VTDPIVILDLFPRHFNVNGDCGNVLCLRRRLEWAGIPVTVLELEPGQAWPQERPDLVHLGGGSLAAQRAALPELVANRERLAGWIAVGMPFLAVAGGFQLSMGTVSLSPGQAEAGLGVFAGSSDPAGSRISGFAVARSEHGLIFGYQNLGQVVRLAPGQPALGDLVHGHGNDSPAATEGAVSGSAIGSNLHGPLLPKNPALADAMIRAALSPRGIPYELGEAHAKADHYAAKGNETIVERLELGKTLTAPSA